MDAMGNPVCKKRAGLKLRAFGRARSLAASWYATTGTQGDTHRLC